MPPAIIKSATSINGPLNYRKFLIAISLLALISFNNYKRQNHIQFPLEDNFSVIVIQEHMLI